MEVNKSYGEGGSLQISSDVIEKIARHASLETEGVSEVAPAVAGPRSVMNKLTPQKPIRVEMKNDVADITVSLIVDYGTKIPELSEAVQENVKEAVQNMTSISVAKVDVVIAGLAKEKPEQENA